MEWPFSAEVAVVESWGDTCLLPTNVLPSDLPARQCDLAWETSISKESSNASELGRLAPRKPHEDFVG